MSNWWSRLQPATEAFAPASVRALKRPLQAKACSTIALLLSFAALECTAAPIDEFFNNFTAEWIRNDPSLATSTRYLKGEEQDRLEREITPQTPAYRRARIQLARRGLAELAKFDRAKLSPTQHVSADLMEWQLKIIADEEPFLDYTFPLNQMDGFNVNVVEALMIRHPLATEKDAENYIAALGQVGARMDEAAAESKRIAAKGILPPKFILQATIKQMRSFADPAPAQNAFVSGFADKMAAIKSLPPARREQLRSQAEKIVTDQIYPAYKNAAALLESQLPRSTDDAGLWRLKGGADAYAFYLRRYTSTNLTPDQIHQIGLNQVDAIEKQMDTLLRRLGRTQGSVKERVEKLQQDLTYPNPTSEASRARIMEDIDGILRDAEKRAALIFNKTPRSSVVAQAFPSFREKNAAANYNAPAPDGSRPGTFQYPRRVEKMTTFGLKSTVYHETVPGHHFQIATELENQELPAFRRLRAFGGISAFGEGWGLYAEHLAAESGWYGDDIEGLLGELDSELFRARRLVVDTGLHAKHWTRQQGIDFGIEASEVERYAARPAQACSYMLGELKIVELREKARKALGDKFSIRDYHDLVLDTGTVPLDLLERQVDAFIRR
ncbi:MAG: DUF885 domain-containing protein [Bryobacterales bacterium]|nr:DUF885 domain-containing protein [Bryobacterales bacterium]